MCRFVVMALALAALAVPAVVAASGSAAPGLLAYEAPDGIHLVRADGTGDHRVPASVHGDQNPRWSPDGTKIVVAHALVGMQGDLVVLDVSAGTRTRIPGAFGESPDWTADGSAIAFDNDRGSDWQLYSVRPDGSHLRALTDTWSFEPAPAPDGTLAYVGEGTKNEYALLTAAEGDPPSELVTHGDAWAPAWWPDGSALAFTTDGDYAGGASQDSHAEIHRIDRDGSGERRLTRNRVWDGDADVSPDGTQIAFETGRFGWLEIALMNADGSHQRRVTRELHGDACCADWQPSP